MLRLTVGLTAHSKGHLDAVKRSGELEVLSQSISSSSSRTTSSTSIIGYSSIAESSTANSKTFACQKGPRSRGSRRGLWMDYLGRIRFPKIGSLNRLHHDVGVLRIHRVIDRQRLVMASSREEPMLERENKKLSQRETPNHREGEKADVLMPSPISSPSPSGRRVHQLTRTSQPLIGCCPCWRFSISSQGL